MYIILFDGVCNLCTGIVAFLIKKDKNALFRFAPIQSEAGQSLLEQYHIHNDDSSLFYFRNSVCYRKSEAILLILKDLGGFWKCFYPLIYLPACLRNSVYFYIARNRYRVFGKRNSCSIPARKFRNRFL